MAPRAAIVIGLLLLTSCSGVRSVQLHPPIPTPPGLIWGYGVEKVGRNPELGRRAAYLKAIDDLMTRGPVLVSKSVEDTTTVINLKPATRMMESSFRLRASSMLQPSLIDSGVDDGYVWVLIGMTEQDLERGWEQFVAWRSQRLEQARTLLQSAQGPDRLTNLKAAFALLDEAGAQDDPSLLYYEAKNALDAENARIAGLENARIRFRSQISNGHLSAAGLTLDRALQNGLDQGAYQQLSLELADRRQKAVHLIAAGDDLFQDAQYKEALARYRQAELIDRDNPQLPSKLAMADRYHRAARSQTVRSTIGMVGWGATRIVGEYLIYKREEEARKRAEAEKAAEEARLEAERIEAEKKEAEKKSEKPGKGGHHPQL